MRLRIQFLISLVVFAVVIAAIASSVFVTNLRLADLQQDGDIASSAEANTGNLAYVCINYFLYQRNLTSWQTMVSSLDTGLSSLNLADPQQQELVNRIVLGLQNVNRTFHESVLTLKSAPLNQSSNRLPQFEALWNNISGQIEQVNFDVAQLSTLLARQENDVNLTNTLLITSLVALFGAYFYLTYHLFFKHTLQSINRLHEKTKKASQENLNQATEKAPKDEFGELSAIFDELIVNLKQTTASKQELEKEIAERKKAEAALLEAQSQLKVYANNLESIVEERTAKIRESEQSYRELYESFGEAFIAADWELNVIHWNKTAERVTTVKAADALGKKIYDVLPELMSVDITPYFESLQKKQPARFMMNTISRETSRDAIFEVSTYPSIQGIIIIVEDKTEEEQTKRLSAIGQTAGMVGHDIRNPLQAITSDLYLIREELKVVPGCAEIAGVQESLSAIEKNIYYINKIVSDLQDYTRPLMPQNKEVDLKQLLYSILANNNIPKNIDTEIVVPNDLLVNTDPAYLQRILSNLVINAVQAMPNGGTLALNAIKKENKVLINVKDTGVGIPEAAKGKIFTPLFTTKSKGQGLGLAVVKRLVNGLKGDITYTSEEGKGTEFIIELPNV